MIDHRLLLEHCCTLDLGSQLHLLSGEATPIRHHDTSSSMWQLIRRSFEVVQRFMPVGSRKRKRISRNMFSSSFLPFVAEFASSSKKLFLRAVVGSTAFPWDHRLFFVRTSCREQAREVYSITDDSDYNFLFLLKQFESTRKNYIITKKIVIYMIKMYMQDIVTMKDIILHNCLINLHCSLFIIGLRMCINFFPSSSFFR